MKYRAVRKFFPKVYNVKVNRVSEIEHKEQ